jgi:hypothetical protein
MIGTAPWDPQSFPSPLQNQKPACRVLAYLDAGNFHLFVAVYIPDGNFSSLTNAGALLYAPNVPGYGPLIGDLDPLIFGGAIAVTSLPNGAIVVSSDSWFPQDLVKTFETDDNYYQFNIGFTASVGGVQVSDSALFTTTATYDTSLMSLSYFSVSPGGGGSGTFRPLQPASLPPDWSSNMACFVTTALVGVEMGSILVLQTVSADCEAMVAASCSPSTCNDNIGRILKVIDPCSLGGCH